jgi:hypothetical protein
MTTAQAGTAGPAEGRCWHRGESGAGTCWAGPAPQPSRGTGGGHIGPDVIACHEGMRGAGAPRCASATAKDAAAGSWCARTGGSRGSESGPTVGRAKDLTPPHPWAAHRSAGHVQ